MSGSISGNLQFNGEIRPGAGSVTNDTISSSADIARSKLAQDAAKRYPIPFTSMRVHDAMQTGLPSPSANDDLGFPSTQTFGTVSWYLNTYDLKAATQTCYARFFFALPAEYDDGETVTLRIKAGMNTTVSDGTATIDAEVYESDLAGGVGSDLCTTAAQSINNLTAANKDFTITPTGLAAGDVLDVRIALAISDSATGTAVIGEVFDVAFLLDVRG